MQTKVLYEFGEFRLDAARRLVLRGEEPVRLHSKALETLLVLVRNRDRVVSKDELMQTLWPDTFVEEVNLAQNISALRKALGETPGENRYIATIPGKGYQFVCMVRETGGAGADELVVARHTRAEVVVEESENEPEGGALPILAAGERSKLGWWGAWGVLAVVLGAGAAGGYWLEHRRARGGAETTAHSVAVLPFQTLVPASDEEHLGLGMADAVTTKLSNIRQLPVRPTDEVIRYSTPGTDPIQAARQMGVDTVLTGKIQRVGDRIRVTVQLVRVSDGRALWAETFDDRYTDIFGVEDSISEKVVQALALDLASEEKLQLARHYTENIDAYRNYLQGRYEEFTFTPDGMYRAIDYFRRAIADDPGYALAYAGLADAYTTESDWLLAPKEALPKADAAARKALEFDDQLAEAHGALAHALLHEWKLKESDREFHIALALNPSNVSTYFAYGEYLASTGQADAAIADMKKALAMDPLSPEINSFLAWDYYMKRDYTSCAVGAAKAIRMFPDFWLPHMAAGMCDFGLHRYEDSLGEFRKALAMNPDNTYSQAAIGVCLAKMGKRAAALEALDQLEAMRSRTYVSPAYVSMIYAGLGDTDAEFVWLEKGYEDQAEWLLWLPIDPMYDSLRDDPRYKALMAKVGI